MKIGIILRKVKLKDGIQQEALTLAQLLRKKGHDVAVYTFEFEKENADPELIQGLRIVTLPHEKICEKERLLGILNRPSFLIRWRKRNCEARNLAHLIDLDTDLLNPHSMNTYAVSAYFKEGIKDIPCVWVVSTIPLHARALVARRELGLLIYESFLKKLFYRLMDEIEIRKFIWPHRIVALAHENQAQVRKWIRRDADVVYTGTDIRRFYFKERRPLYGKKINILLTGKLFEYRRFEDAIEAAKILLDKGYDPYVNIVGAYEHRMSYYEKLRELIKRLGLESRVSFLRFVPEETLVETYQKADLVVSPVVAQEAGIGLTIMDAMSCGIPLVISRGAAATEVFTHRENAFFINPKAPQEIAEAVETLFREPDLYVALSRSARKFIKENLTWEKYACNLERIFQEEVKYVSQT